MRKILEQNSGQSLQKFFDQWIYQAGHPDIKAVFSIDNSTLNLKILQTQTNDFHFDLESTNILQMDNNTDKKIEDTLIVEDKEVNKTYSIPQGAKIKRIVIDPNLKILKRLTITIPDKDNAILVNSLLDGETIGERIYAARALRNIQSNELVDSLKKVILQNNVYWKVSAEAAKTLGTIKTEEWYNALKECITLCKEQWH